MRTIRGYVVTFVTALLALGCLPFHASATATSGPEVVIQLRVDGDAEALRPIRSCLAEKLSQMPDVKVTTTSTDGARFVVDIVAAKNAGKKISASVVVAEIFPMEQFRPRIIEGEDREALLTSIQYYTLLRMHEVLPARSHQTLCNSIVTDIGDKVLFNEFTERNE